MKPKTWSVCDGEGTLYQGDSLEYLRSMPERSVDMIFGSPPYCDARTYEDETLPEGFTIELNPFEWVEWMFEFTRAALRVSRGAVVWVAAGRTQDRNYYAACEGLAWEWFRNGKKAYEGMELDVAPSVIGGRTIGSMYRPVYWRRNGIPGSGADQWFRSDVEYCFCFKRPGPLPYANNLAHGHVPKAGKPQSALGGDTTRRDKTGKRYDRKGYMQGTQSVTLRDEHGEVGRATPFGAMPSKSGVSKHNKPTDKAFNGEESMVFFDEFGEIVKSDGRSVFGGGYANARAKDGKRASKEPKGLKGHKSAMFFDEFGEAQKANARPYGGTDKQNHMTKDGKRVGMRMTGSQSVVNGVILANPGNWIDTGAGGSGAMGSKIASENEAPFPEKLVRFFVQSLSKRADTVMDPFGGSGTTASICHQLGRKFVTGDVRGSQIELIRKRLDQAELRKGFGIAQ